MFFIYSKYKNFSEMPMGQMPVLEIDGKKYCQSKAICRYLGKKSGLYGKDDFEAMEIDATADALHDISTAIGIWWWEKNEEQKAKLKETAFTKMNNIMNKLEEQVKRNGGYFVGGKVLKKRVNIFELYRNMMTCF